jgi:cell cycle checkpoint protein
VSLQVLIDADIRLDAVTRREQSLGLFHALGKVFYNKRLSDPAGDKEDQEAIDAMRKLPPDDLLPNHLSDFGRSKSMVQMEVGPSLSLLTQQEFIPTIPVDASTFALWIHHNVPQFCDEIEELSAILDDFGAADLMRTDDDIVREAPVSCWLTLLVAVEPSGYHIRAASDCPRVPHGPANPSC